MAVFKAWANVTQDGIYCGHIADQMKTAHAARMEAFIKKDSAD